MALRLDLEPARYRVRCVFCRCEHESEYWDDLEAEILRCRDEAPSWKRGDLDSYKEPLVRPISPETSALMATASARGPRPVPDLPPHHRCPD